MPTALIDRWRAQVVYEPGVIARLEKGWRGFNRQWESRDEIEAVLRQLAFQRMDPERQAANPTT
jgi:hypothetical protein